MSCTPGLLSAGIDRGMREGKGVASVVAFDEMTESGKAGQYYFSLSDGLAARSLTGRSSSSPALG